MVENVFNTYITVCLPQYGNSLQAVEDALQLTAKDCKQWHYAFVRRRLHVDIHNSNSHKAQPSIYAHAPKLSSSNCPNCKM